MTTDPMTALLAAFDSIPADVLPQMFADFEASAQSKDLRRLLDTMSDWSATADVYANPDLANALRQDE